MGEKTLYSVLEVSSDASAEVIGAAHARLKALLEPKAAAGDEAALTRLQALHDAHRTLSDPGLRARYDTTLRQRVVQFQPVTDSGTGGLARWLPTALIALAVAGSCGWYYSYKQRADRAKAERALREKSEALAKAEAERQRIESETAAKEAARQKRLEDFRYQQWVDQARRDGAENMRRNEAARQRAEAEERRERQREERMQELERTREEAAARRRLEEEKRRLRELQYQNSRY